MIFGSLTEITAKSQKTRRVGSKSRVLFVESVKIRRVPASKSTVRTLFVLHKKSNNICANKTYRKNIIVILSQINPSVNVQYY